MILKIEDPSAQLKLVDTIKNGGLAIVPCDTIYGFVGTVPVTEQRIHKIKGRDEGKPFLQLIGSVEELIQHTGITPDEKLLPYWPGPLTLILPFPENSTTAFRVPANPFLADLLAGVKQPLYSTSVNRSGKPALSEIHNIIEEFEQEVDLIIDGGSLAGAKPSTILDVTSRPYTVLRPGACELPAELLV